MQLLILLIIYLRWYLLFWIKFLLILNLLKLLILLIIYLRGHLLFYIKFLLILQLLKLLILLIINLIYLVLARTKEISNFKIFSWRSDNTCIILIRLIGFWWLKKIKLISICLWRKIHNLRTLHGWLWIFELMITLKLRNSSWITTIHRRWLKLSWRWKLNLILLYLLRCF